MTAIKAISKLLARNVSRQFSA